jgi:hypothetical protein
MHRDVKFMANLFVREALDIFDRYFTDDNDPYNESPLPADHEPAKSREIPWSLEELSSIERGRLFRPLYRFIIFGNLFGGFIEDSATAAELSEHFLCRFPSWQVEEISCINDFVTNNIIRKCQEMEDYVFKCLTADSELLKLRGNEDDWEVHWYSNFFSKNAKHKQYRHRQASLAKIFIKNIRTLFSVSDDALETFVSDFSTQGHYFGRPFLEEALLFDPGHIPTEPNGDIHRCDAYQDNLGEG